MYSFNELSESQKLTAEEKKTAKQILGLLNGQNHVAAKQMLDVVICRDYPALLFLVNIKSTAWTINFNTGSHTSGNWTFFRHFNKHNITSVL